MFIGIDLSLTGTGVVVLNKDKEIIKQELIKSTPKQETEERLTLISNNVYDICMEYPDSKISIEGLAFGARGQSMLELAALHYITRTKLWVDKISFEIIPPTVIKKYITGKGNAKKELMLAHVVKKFDILFEDNNICDAFCLAMMALEDK